MSTPASPDDIAPAARSADAVTARGMFLALDREQAAALFPHLAAG